MQEKKQKRSIGQCKCCRLHFFDDCGNEELCEHCLRFITYYTKQVREDENKRLENQIDYIMKINIWLMKKYGKQFREDMGINENDNSVENLIKISKVYDDIYEEINKEMPKKWNEYGFSGLNMGNK